MPGAGKMTETAPGSRKWRLRVYAGRDSRGRVQHVNRTVTGSKRAAQAELTKMLADVERGTLRASHPITVSELLDRWLTAVAQERTAQTMKEYRRLAEVNIRPALGSVRVDKLTGEKIDAFYASLTVRGLKPTSVRRHHALLHVVLGRAVKWGLISANPADRATPPVMRDAIVTAPSVEGVQRLIEAAERDGEPVLATAVVLGAVTGCRRGELCALRWSDVDWQRGVLRVVRSLTVINGVASEVPTKTHSRRYIAIDDAMQALLAQRHADQQTYAARTGAALVADAYILSRSADGSTPCKPDGLTSAYARLAATIGQHGHFHELRHFAATVAISSGTDVRTVAGRLGHADTSVTLRVYAHALEARDRELAGLLGQAVLGAKRRHKVRPENDPVPAEMESARQLTVSS